jgi:hypothetical protein
MVYGAPAEVPWPRSRAFLSRRDLRDDQSYRSIDILSNGCDVMMELTTMGTMDLSPKAFMILTKL